MHAVSLTAKFSVHAASCGLLAWVAATSVGPSGCGFPAEWPTGTAKWRPDRAPSNDDSSAGKSRGAQHMQAEVQVGGVLVQC
jgi:hypothetical protein